MTAGKRTVDCRPHAGSGLSALIRAGAFLVHVAGRVGASVAGEDVGAHLAAAGAWWSSLRTGRMTLDSGHGRAARLLRRSQKKLDSRITGLCTDAADQIAVANVELVGELSRAAGEGVFCSGTCRTWRLFIADWPPG